MATKKPIRWMGGSRSDLSAMPDAVRKDFGGALATPQADIDLIERRLKDARALHAQLQRKTP